MYKRQVSVSELKELCFSFGYHFSDDELALAHRELDTDSSGSLEYDEFAQWWGSQSRFENIGLDSATLERRKAAAEVFRNYDSDANGSIDASEFDDLHQALTKAGVTSHSKEKCLEDLDVNSDGVVEFNEFIEWLER